MTKGIIYYTDNRLEKKIADVCMEQLKLSGLPIVSCSLEPMSFGKNIALSDRDPGYSAMVEQIIRALQASSVDVVFFCEHDVLYHPSHFMFEPEEDNCFYYNRNNWRWAYPADKLVTFDELLSLSGLCVYREKALEHFTRRWRSMERHGWDKLDEKNPRYARRWGYEPGLKSKRRGGYCKEKTKIYWSAFPNIDIRHGKGFSLSKTDISTFRKKPTNWVESHWDGIPGWNIKEIMPWI